MPFVDRCSGKHAFNLASFVASKPTEWEGSGWGAADDGRGLDGRQGSADSGQLSLSLTRAIRASSRDVVKHYCTQSVDRPGKSAFVKYSRKRLFAVNRTFLCMSVTIKNIVCLVLLIRPWFKNVQNWYITLDVFIEVSNLIWMSYTMDDTVRGYQRAME